jgi:hypothetical protein
MSTQSRKHRGYRTQRLVAEYLSYKFPHCYSVGAGEAGKDIRNTPRYSVEVKGRRGFNPLAALKQARANAEEGDKPVAILRMDGQGEDVGEWLIVMQVKDYRWE